MKHIKSKAEFEQLINENNNVVIDFYATWCGPCKMLAPIFEQVANEKPEVTFVKVDVDEAGELAGLFGITSIPTVVYIKNEKLALRELGFKPKAAILQNIKTIYE
jgi:thioredoxin 1